MRRPKRSDSGPITSCPRPSPSRVPVSVNCTVAEDVSRSVLIVGSAGRYMSMVNGPSAMSAPSTSTSRRRAPRVSGTAATTRSGVSVTKV